EEQADARLTEGGRMGRRRGCPTWRCLVPSTTLSDSHSGTGRVAEWFKAPVLKTGVPARVPWVRIPPLPPEPIDIIKLFGFPDNYAQSNVQSVWDDADTLGLIVFAVALVIFFC